MNSKKIILYDKYFDFAKDLTDEQFGRVLRAIGKVFINNDESAADALSKGERMLYNIMKYEIKIDFDKYEQVCEKRRKAGKISAEKRWGS